MQSQLSGGSQTLFQVETVLSAPEIVLSPPAGELYKLMMQAVRDTVERLVQDLFCPESCHGISQI